VSQLHCVVQVHTGSHWQLQFWQAQEALDGTGDLAGFVFMGDLVSSPSTEPFPGSYTVPREILTNWRPIMEASPIDEPRSGSAIVVLSFRRRRDFV
jgi:hypothetical protein